MTRQKSTIKKHVVNEMKSLGVYKKEYKKIIDVFVACCTSMKSLRNSSRRTITRSQKSTQTKRGDEEGEGGD